MVIFTQLCALVLKYFLKELVWPQKLKFLAYGVRQGMGIMHSDVMDTVFHSGDAWNAEVSTVLRWEYFPMLNVWDLLVTFHWRWVNNLQAPVTEN